MNTILFNLLARFVNDDVIAKYVRGFVAAGFAALLAWKGAWLMPFLTPEVQTAVTAAIVGLAVGVWGQIAQKVSAPTKTDVVNVMKDAATTGVVPQATAAKVVANPAIAMPDKAAGNLG